MIRRALLIGVGSARGESALPGTYKDIDMLSRYLQSLSGGAWSTAEVRVLSDPNRSTVRQATTWLSGADFSFVSFSGHGCEREVELYPGLRVPVTHMVCSDGLEVTRNELTPNNGKSVVLLDCCRVLHVMEKRADSVGAILGRQGQPTISAATARHLFEQAVANAQLGPEFVYGCQFDGTASDLPSFTSSLVATSAEWARQASGTLDLERAFRGAVALHQRISPGHNPELDMGRGSVHRPVPFAVGNLVASSWR